MKYLKHLDKKLGSLKILLRAIVVILISTLLFIVDVTSDMSYYVLLEDNLAKEEQATANVGKILSIYMN